MVGVFLVGVGLLLCLEIGILGAMAGLVAFRTAFFKMKKN